MSTRLLVTLTALLWLAIACAPPPPSRVVVVVIGDGWATSYDSILSDGIDMLDATGWSWELGARGQRGDVTIEHATLDCAADIGGYFDPLDPTHVHIDPVCSSGVIPLVVAHELLHWAGCSHVSMPGSVLSAEISDAPGCDPTVHSCTPNAMTAADIAEWRRVHP